MFLFYIFEFSTVIQKDVAHASTTITILCKQINKIFEIYLLRSFKKSYI